MSDTAHLRRRRSRPLLRVLLGDALRRSRLSQRRTLADVARHARVSVPYLSEVERGRKEASSEVLAAVCEALRIELSDLLGEARRDLLGEARRDLLARAGRDGAAEHTRVVGLEGARRHRNLAVPTRRPGDVVLLAA